MFIFIFMVLGSRGSQGSGAFARCIVKVNIHISEFSVNFEVGQVCVGYYALDMALRIVCSIRFPQSTPPFPK